MHNKCSRYIGGIDSLINLCTINTEHEVEIYEKKVCLRDQHRNLFTTQHPVCLTPSVTYNPVLTKHKIKNVCHVICLPKNHSHPSHLDIYARRVQKTTIHHCSDKAREEIEVQQEYAQRRTCYELSRFASTSVAEYILCAPHSSSLQPCITTAAPVRKYTRARLKL